MRPDPGARALRVALTGGIGAGKSEVARQLASYGAFVVDADQLARDVVAPGTPGLAAVATEFGAGVLHPDGSLDRERLAALVFADDAARRRLEAIVHPLVAERSRALLAAAPAGSIAVYDVALVVESDLAGDFDVVVVVDVPEQVQLARLTTQRGMTEAAARQRIAAQAPREHRLAAADIVVDNSGSKEELQRRVEDLWADLLRRSPLALPRFPQGHQPAPASGSGGTRKPRM